MLYISENFESEIFSISYDVENPTQFTLIGSPDYAGVNEAFITLDAISGTLDSELIEYFEGINDGEEYDYNEELLVATIDIIPDSINEIEVIVNTKTIFDEGENVLSLQTIKSKSIYYNAATIDNYNASTVYVPFGEGQPLNDLVGQNANYYDYFVYQAGYTIYPAFGWYNDDYTKLNIYLRIVAGEIFEYPVFDLNINIIQKY